MEIDGPDYCSYSETGTLIVKILAWLYMVVLATAETVLIVLRATSYITMSWVLVFLPLIITASLFIVTFLGIIFDIVLGTE